MDWVQFAVQWLHVLGGIFWFGASLTVNFIFVPALLTLPFADQQRVGAAFGRSAERVIRPAAVLVIVLGVLRGTVFGPIRSADALTTQYGITWLVALIAAIATFAWAEARITPTLHRLNKLDSTTAVGPDGKPSAELTTILDVAKRNSLLEMVGFFVIFTCMILMRFGL